jgi:ATP-binding cassette subfamily B protein
MFRLLKYVKPYIWLVILAIALLFVLANADLSLPDYLSQIVNIGIQQNGVDSDIPSAIRDSQMTNLILFLTPNEQDLVLDSYQFIDQDAAGFEDALATYPLVQDEPIYILRELDKEATDKLQPIMARGLSLLYGITQITENPDQASALISELPYELPDLPAGMDLFTALRMAPEERIATFREQIAIQYDTLPSTLTEQLTAQAIKEEYDALGVDLGKLQTNYILRTGGIMILVALVAGIANIAVSFLASRTSAGVARDIREDVFKKVESFSSQEFRKFSTASLITRATNDVTQIQQVVFMIIRMAFFAPIIGIGGVLHAIDKSPNMWWIIALAVGILLVLIIVVFFIATPKFKIIQKLIDRLNLVVRENLSGMMVIRAFNKQAFEEKRFDEANKDLTDVMLFINRVMAAIMPLMMLVMNGLSVLIIWVGAQQIADSTLLVGDMMAFLQYSMQIMFAFLMLSMMFIFLPRAFVSGDRIAEVLETENIIKDPAEPKALPENLSGKIEFRDVCFKYPDAEECVLNDINFTVLPGEVTAFIGSTGSGKSTLVNLIPRFYDVNQGAVLIDGIDVRDVGQHELRDQIGYVPQHGILFSGTVESNLRFADQDAEEAILRESIEIAQAADFVFDNPEGFKAEISQGGANVSGGQKQRLSIARALVKRPPIYIFDDSFSALDFKTDSALRRALKEKTGESTVLMVTQRVATVKAADQIVVLDNGNIVGKGTHQELMKSCQTYQEIATSQLSEEELA